MELQDDKIFEKSSKIYLFPHIAKNDEIAKLSSAWFS